MVSNTCVLFRLSSLKGFLVQRFKEREMKSTLGMSGRLRTWNDSYMWNKSENMFYFLVYDLLSMYVYDNLRPGHSPHDVLVRLLID